MAVIPFMWPTANRWAFMVLLAPQQILLLSHLMSIEMALFSGHYADGYIPKGGAYFIFADQIWLLMVIFFPHARICGDIQNTGCCRVDPLVAKAQAGRCLTEA